MATLFIGCSHTCGYQYLNKKASLWNENCYPLIYSKNTDSEVVVYAETGVGNYSYPNYVQSVLQRHKIDKIVIQSTYWNRYPIACSQSLDHNFDRYTIDCFIGNPIHKDNATLYSDCWINDGILKLNSKHLNFQKFKGFNLSIVDDNPENLNDVLAEIESESYSYTKLWFETQTYIQYERYIRDLLIIDRLCEKNNIPCYLWRINDRMDMPDRFDLYGEFTNIKIEKESAETWIKNKFNIDIRDKTMDGEHYDKTVHELIANNFLKEKLGI